MRTVVLLLLCALMMVTCAKDEPAGLSQDQIIDILVDMHVAEGLINSHHPVRMKDTLHMMYRDQVFEHHNVTISDFELGLARVHEDPAALDNVYQTVVKKLQERSSNVDKKFDSNQKIKEANDGLY